MSTTETLGSKRRILGVGGDMDPQIDPLAQYAEPKRTILRMGRFWDTVFSRGRKTVLGAVRGAWRFIGSRQLMNVLILLLILVLVALVQQATRIAAGQDIQGYFLMKTMEQRGMSPRQLSAPAKPEAIDPDALMKTGAAPAAKPASDPMPTLPVK